MEKLIESNFIKKHNLKPGDRIIVPKSDWDVVQHHVIYRGVDYAGRHIISENKDAIGVRRIYLYDLISTSSKITSINPFKGTEYERQLALKRADEKLGEKYILFSFNCEHYCDYVQHGKSSSKQVEYFRNASLLLVGTILIGYLFSRD